MFIPSPSLTPIVRFENVNDFLSEFEGVQNVVGGVAVYGAAAAYALVWELGSRRLKSPGPKTLWSLNRDGDIAILTRQAPRGYIGFHGDEFEAIIASEFSKVKFSSSTAKGLYLEMSVAMDNASQRIAALISSYAPVDTGELASSIEMVDSDDMGSMGSSNAESDGTFVL